MFKKGNKNEIKNLIQNAEKNEKNEKFFDAIQNYEHAKFLIKNNLNQDKKLLPNINKKICELSNMLSILFLQQENYKACLDLLQKAEECAKGSDECLALTYNNYACFYKSTGKYRVALNFLQEALIVEKKKSNNKNIADIFLNICAVLSKLQKHDEAFQASMNSIILIQEEILNYCIPIVFKKQKQQKENKKPKSKNISRFIKQGKKSQNSLNLQVPKSFHFVKSTKFDKKDKVCTEAQITNKYHSNTLKNDSDDQIIEELNSKERNAILERVVILSIAYHNLAVELEHLHLYEDSMCTYQKAYNFSQSVLGQNADVVINLQKILETAKDQLKKKIKKKETKKYRIQKKKRIFSNYHLKQRKLLEKKKPYSAIKEDQQKKDKNNESYDIQQNFWNDDQIDLSQDDDHFVLQNTLSQMQKSQSSVKQDQGVISIIKQKIQSGSQQDINQIQEYIEEESSQSDDQTEQTKQDNKKSISEYNINISVSAIQKTDPQVTESSKQEIMDQFRQKLSPQNLCPQYKGLDKKKVLFNQQCDQNSEQSVSEKTSKTSSDSQIKSKLELRQMSKEHQRALQYKKSFAKEQQNDYCRENLSSSSSDDQYESNQYSSDNQDLNKTEQTYNVQYGNGFDESIKF